MLDGSNNNIRETDNWKLSNQNDPIDKLIIELAEKGELKVKLVNIKGKNKRFLKKYSFKSILPKIKHTS